MANIIIGLFLLYNTGYDQIGIVIVHEKGVFIASFFRNISKAVETILIKKIGRNHVISVYKKDLMSEHRKNYIF